MRAKKKVVSMPPVRALHHIQLPEMPFCTTSSFTAKGVSAAKVVATMLMPAKYHGILRPPRKNSDELLPARLLYHKPIPSDSAKYAAMITQSIVSNISPLPLPLSQGRGGLNLYCRRLLNRHCKLNRFAFNFKHSILLLLNKRTLLWHHLIL